MKYNNILYALTGCKFYSKNGILYHIDKTYYNNTKLEIKLSDYFNSISSNCLWSKVWGTYRLTFVLDDNIDCSLLNTVNGINLDITNLTHIQLKSDPFSSDLKNENALERNTLKYLSQVNIEEFINNTDIYKYNNTKYKYIHIMLSHSKEKYTSIYSIVRDLLKANDVVLADFNSYLEPIIEDLIKTTPIHEESQEVIDFVAQNKTSLKEALYEDIDIELKKLLYISKDKNIIQLTHNLELIYSRKYTTLFFLYNGTILLRRLVTKFDGYYEANITDSLAVLNTYYYNSTDISIVEAYSLNNDLHYAINSLYLIKLGSIYVASNKDISYVIKPLDGTYTIKITRNKESITLNLNTMKILKGTINAIIGTDFYKQYASKIKQKNPQPYIRYSCHYNETNKYKNLYLPFECVKITKLKHKGKPKGYLLSYANCDSKFIVNNIDLSYHISDVIDLEKTPNIQAKELEDKNYLTELKKYLSKSS